MRVDPHGNHTLVGGLYLAWKWLVPGFGVAFGLGGEGAQPRGDPAQSKGA